MTSETLASLAPDASVQPFTRALKAFYEGYAISDANRAFAEQFDEIADRLRTGTSRYDLAPDVARLARMMGEE